MDNWRSQPFNFWAADFTDINICPKKQACVVLLSVRATVANLISRTVDRIMSITVSEHNSIAETSRFVYVCRTLLLLRTQKRNLQGYKYRKAVYILYRVFTAGCLFFGHNVYICARVLGRRKEVWSLRDAARRKYSENSRTALPRIRHADNVDLWHCPVIYKSLAERDGNGKTIFRKIIYFSNLPSSRYTQKLILTTIEIYRCTMTYTI